MDQQELLETGFGTSQSAEGPLVLGDQQIGASLHPRLAWMMYFEETRSVQAVADKFGISRKTFYKWYKRYKDSNSDSGSLSDRSRRPHRCPRATPEASIQLLKMVKQETGFGQRRLRAYLEQKYHVRMSERTIWKILKQSGVESSAAKA